MELNVYDKVLLSEAWLHDHLYRTDHPARPRVALIMLHVLRGLYRTLTNKTDEELMQEIVAYVKYKDNNSTSLWSAETPEQIYAFKEILRKLAETVDASPKDDKESMVFVLFVRMMNIHCQAMSQHIGEVMEQLDRMNTELVDLDKKDVEHVADATH